MACSVFRECIVVLWSWVSKNVIICGFWVGIRLTKLNTWDILEPSHSDLLLMKNPVSRRLLSQFLWVSIQVLLSSNIILFCLSLSISSHDTWIVSCGWIQAANCYLCIVSSQWRQYTGRRICIRQQTKQSCNRYALGWNSKGEWACG